MSPVIGFARELAAHPQGLPELMEPAWGWLEAPCAVRLDWLCELSDWQDAARWPAGRIFGEAGEYRWQRWGERLHGVLLLETGPLPPQFAGVIELRPGEDADLVLWGEWVDPDEDREGNPDRGPRFFASEIPEVVAYPLELTGKPEPGTTPRLKARRYRDLAGRRGEFVRCVGLWLKRDEGKEAARE